MAASPTAVACGNARSELDTGPVGGGAAPTPILVSVDDFADNANVEMSGLVPKAFKQAELAITTAPGHVPGHLRSVGAKFVIDDPDKYFSYVTEGQKTKKKTQKIE